MAVVTTTLRPMAAADVAAVARLERASFPQPWSPRVLREELAGRGRAYLVAESAGEVVGYGGLALVGEDAHVLTLAVAPAARRRGIATRLMTALVEAALSAGAAHLTLEVRSGNGAAIGLYRRFGFEPAGVRPRYYPDDDAVVMWARDIGGEDYRARLDRIAGRSM